MLYVTRNNAKSKKSFRDIIGIEARARMQLGKGIHQGIGQVDDFSRTIKPRRNDCTNKDIASVVRVKALPVPTIFFLPFLFTLLRHNCKYTARAIVFLDLRAPLSRLS